MTDAYRSNREAAYTHLDEILRENDELRRKLLALESDQRPSPSQPAAPPPRRGSAGLLTGLLIGATLGGAWVHALERSWRVAHESSPFVRGGSPCPFAARESYHSRGPCPFAHRTHYERVAPGPAITPARAAPEVDTAAAAAAADDPSKSR